MSRLTPRMKNWLAGSGAHIGTATRSGVPTVVVADAVRFEGDEVAVFALTRAQADHVGANLAENPQVAFGPGGLGSIRAAYQFKGRATLAGEELRVEVTEIYSTRDMGTHYRGLRISGGLALAFAAASLPLHHAIPHAPRALLALTVLSIGLAAFFATGFFWFTIAKVAEITVERRTERTRQAVAVVAVSALALGAGTVLLVLAGDPRWPLALRAAVAAFTAAFLLCRYAVHCYKTQRSIGATFTADPAEQFWV